MRLLFALGCLVVWLEAAGARAGTDPAGEQGTAYEFIGSTPCGIMAGAFPGRLDAEEACHAIGWHLTLFTNRVSGEPGKFHLRGLAKIPTRSNPNISENGPQMEWRGTWKVEEDPGPAGGRLYRLLPEPPGRPMVFRQISDRLLHWLNADGSLAVGGGGWSYTLNRAERSETTVDHALALRAPDMSYRISPRATGSNVFGIFEGRSPCHGIARQLQLPRHAGCTKVKWRLTLFQEPGTSRPTRYRIEGSLHRQQAREGVWSMERGTPFDPLATVFHLGATATEPALRLLRGDDHVLFFLDQAREPMVGNAEFSYTLNRSANVPAPATGKRD